MVDKSTKNSQVLLFTCVQRPHPHFSMPIIRILIISPIFYLYDFIPLSILPKKKIIIIITHEFEQILGDLAIVVLVTKMRSFKFAMLLLSLWVITLLSLTKTESAPTYSTHYCSNSTFFIANSTYQTNLNLVLSSLNSNATDNNNNGFYNASAGDNPADDVVFGLFLCRGDVNTAVCQDCVVTASKHILRRCPLDKVAIIIWYEECLLRYSNQSIFATINEVPGFYLVSIRIISQRQRVIGLTMYWPKR